MIQITITQLQEYFRQEYIDNPQSFQDSEILSQDYDFSKDDEENYEDDIYNYIDESQNWLIINSEYFAYNPRLKTFVIDNSETSTTIFHRLKAYTSWIWRSYHRDNYPWETNAWDIGICSGDDDVDYNGSYLDCLMELILYYLIHNNLIKS